jgi:hypothetical protein
MPTYLTSDGRGATRMFQTEPDALIFWYYNNCKGYLYQLQDDTGIVMDEARRDTRNWNSGSVFNTGNRSQISAIVRYMNELAPFDYIPRSTTPLIQTTPQSQNTHTQVAHQPPNPPIREPLQLSNPLNQETLPVTNVQPPQVESNDIKTVEAVPLIKENNLEEEIKRLRTFVTISDAEIVEKNKELEEAWRLELEERNKLEQTKQSILREKQREEEAEKIFESGKQTYRQLKREICTGVITPENIPDQFIRRYLVYKRMDEAGLIDLPNDWESYQDFTDQLKEEEFNADKVKYYELKDNITRGESKESDVPLEFENQYRVFKVMDAQGVLDDENSYDTFLELLGDYMGAWNDCKYALSNDAHYLEDVNIKPHEIVSSNDETDDGPLLSTDEAREKYGIVAGTDAAEQLQGMNSFLDV